MTEPTKTAPAKPAAPVRYKRVKVRATAPGYYDEKYYRIGDVFTIDGTPRAPLEADAPKEAKARAKQREGKPAAFSDKWMELVDPRTPEQITSHNAALRQQHDETQQARGASGGPPIDNPTGDANPLGDD